MIYTILKLKVIYLFLTFYKKIKKDLEVITPPNPSLI
jgi:hypothetical protein